MNNLLNQYKRCVSFLGGTSFLLLLTSLLLGAQFATAQCTTVEDLKEGGQVETSLYFYPSTLRMVNLDHNEEFNQLIKEVEKLIFFKMNANFSSTEFYNLTHALVQDEKMEEYIVVDGPEKKFYLLGREGPEETVGLMMIDDQPYVIDIKGGLDIGRLPKLYQYISENDSTLKNKFSGIINLINQQSNNHN